MNTALDASSDALDEDEREFVAKIREHGWFRTSVLSDDDGAPNFAYTTGFEVNTRQPELLIFSLKSDIVRDLFWNLFRDAEHGVVLPVGKRTDDVFGNLPAFAFRIAHKHYRNYLGWSRWFYGGDNFECLQIVWPDPAGHFPWEPSFDAEFRADQIDLTEHGWANEIVA